MATEKIYLGVNNIARNVKKVYIGVNDTARKVSKIYRGVNGVAVEVQKAENESIKNAVKFSSDGNFTLSVVAKGQDGTMEYSLNDGDSQSTWTGSSLSGTAAQPIYIRGKNNTVVTGGISGKQTFTGKYADGNLENLINYETVKQGNHPTMGRGCFQGFLYGCTSLVRAPELQSLTLANEGCSSIYKGCTNLLKVPYIAFLFGDKNGTPGTISGAASADSMFEGCSSLNGFDLSPSHTGFNIYSLHGNCFARMFYGCTSLTRTYPIRIQNSTRFVQGCFISMYEGCTSLIIPSTIVNPNGAANQTRFDINCFTKMYKGCSALKVQDSTSSPNQRTIITIPSSATIDSGSFTDMFLNTGGTFTGTPIAGRSYNYYT